MNHSGAPSQIRQLVRNAARQKLLFLAHAVKQMSRPDRMITVQEVRGVVLHGEIVEDYPNDERGHSCLILGTGDMGRTIHVVCAPKDGYLAIVTAYLPEADEWEPGFKNRRSK
jgi:hypothetical protein